MAVVLRPLCFMLHFMIIIANMDGKEASGINSHMGSDVGQGSWKMNSLLPLFEAVPEREPFESSPFNKEEGTKRHMRELFGNRHLDGASKNNHFEFIQFWAGSNPDGIVAFPKRFQAGIDYGKKKTCRLEINSNSLNGENGRSDPGIDSGAKATGGAMPEFKVTSEIGVKSYVTGSNGGDTSSTGWEYSTREVYSTEGEMDSTGGVTGASETATMGVTDGDVGGHTVVSMSGPGEYAMSSADEGSTDTDMAAGTRGGPTRAFTVGSGGITVEIFTGDVGEGQSPAGEIKNVSTPEVAVRSGEDPSDGVAIDGVRGGSVGEEQIGVVTGESTDGGAEKGTAGAVRVSPAGPIGTGFLGNDGVGSNGGQEVRSVQRGSRVARSSGGWFVGGPIGEGMIVNGGGFDGTGEHGFGGAQGGLSVARAFGGNVRGQPVTHRTGRIVRGPNGSDMIGGIGRGSTGAFSVRSGGVSPSDESAAINGSRIDAGIVGGSTGAIGVGSDGVGSNASRPIGAFSGAPNGIGVIGGSGGHPNETITVRSHGIGSVGSHGVGSVGSGGVSPAGQGVAINGSRIDTEIVGGSTGGIGVGSDGVGSNASRPIVASSGRPNGLGIIGGSGGHPNGTLVLRSHGVGSVLSHGAGSVGSGGVSKTDESAVINGSRTDTGNVGSSTAAIGVRSDGVGSNASRPIGASSGGPNGIGIIGGSGGHPNGTIAVRSHGVGSVGNGGVSPTGEGAVINGSQIKTGIVGGSTEAIGVGSDGVSSNASRPIGASSGGPIGVDIIRGSGGHPNGTLVVRSHGVESVGSHGVSSVVSGGVTPAGVGAVINGSQVKTGIVGNSTGAIGVGSDGVGSNASRPIVASSGGPIGIGIIGGSDRHPTGATVVGRSGVGSNDSSLIVEVTEGSIGTARIGGTNVGPAGVNTTGSGGVGSTGEGKVISVKGGGLERFGLIGRSSIGNDKGPASVGSIGDHGKGHVGGGVDVGSNSARTMGGFAADSPTGSLGVGKGRAGLKDVGLGGGGDRIDVGMSGGAVENTTEVITVGIGRTEEVRGIERDKNDSRTAGNSTGPIAVERTTRAPAAEKGMIGRDSVGAELIGVLGKGLIGGGPIGAIAVRKFGVDAGGDTKDGINGTVGSGVSGVGSTSADLIGGHGVGPTGGHGFKIGEVGNVSDAIGGSAKNREGPIGGITAVPTATGMVPGGFGGLNGVTTGGRGVVRPGFVTGTGEGPIGRSVIEDARRGSILKASASSASGGTVGVRTGTSEIKGVAKYLNGAGSDETDVVEVAGADEMG